MKNISYCPIYRYPPIYTNRSDISSIKHWTMKYETNNKAFRYIYCGLCLFVLKCTGYDKFKYKGSMM